VNKKSTSKDIVITKTTTVHVNAVYEQIATIIREARTKIARAIDTTMVYVYWRIGRYIVEGEQRGAARAGYGQELLQELSERLTKEFGSGFGADTLDNARKFYLVYKDEISDAARRKSLEPQFKPNLSWTHYRTLMRISRSDVRRFYEIEASENNWSSRELTRQTGSLLYERLAKSKDKKGLMRLALKGHEITKPEDSIKEPVVLEFLGIPESHKLVESKLEEALITNMQNFLLELGKGFAFVARQKRLTLDGKHYYCDLVFYHIKLKCYYILELKNRELSHADLGQMLLYVNYFDQEIKTEEENPTIGLILCTEKSNAMVRYTLGDKAKQIFASKYQFNLPTEKELEAELKRGIKDIKYRFEHEKGRQ
jgi:predicted nuclease of restriction endonuclease-like (RecB) superfamily